MFRVAGGGTGGGGGGSATFAGLTDNQTADIIGTNTGVGNLAASDANKISIPSGWNATTNIPALASGTAATSNCYIVTTAGTTNLDGISTWAINDLAIFGAGGVATWTRVAAAAVAAWGSITGTLSAQTDLALALTTQDTNAQSGTTYTFVLGDAAVNVDLNNASAITLTIPPNSGVAFPVKTWLYWTQVGAGTVTVAPGAGVTFVKPAALTLAISAQYQTGAAYQSAANTWRVYCN